VHSVAEPVDTSETVKRQVELEVIRPILDMLPACITEQQREHIKA
jgi:hypothetical protein